MKDGKVYVRKNGTISYYRIKWVMRGLKLWKINLKN